MVTKTLTRMMILTTVCLLMGGGLALGKTGFPVVRGTGDNGPALLIKTTDFNTVNQSALLGYMDSVSGNTWFRTWGLNGIAIYPNDLAMDNTGSVVFVCTGRPPSIGNIEPYPAYAVKYNKNGALTWAKSINWSNHRLEFNAVDVDDYGNAYITGRAFLIYEEYFERGYVFTCKLSPDGELLWAQRWAADYRTYSGGRGIAVSGPNVAVLADNWILNDPNDAQSVIVLFYDTSNASLKTSDILSAGENFTAAGLAANNQGDIMAICWLNVASGGQTTGSAVVMPFYSDSGVFQFDQWWYNGQGEYASALDIASQGRLFYICGGIGRIPSPPHPSAPSLILHNPLVMIYDGAVALLIEEVEDDSPLHVDSKFTSISPHSMSGGSGSVWFAGHAFFDTQYSPIKTQHVGASGFGTITRSDITAWEAENCGASVFDVTDYTEKIPANNEVFAWLNTATISGYECPDQYIYAGSLIFTSAPPPNALVTADATQVTTSQTVNFDASGSTISQGTIADYQWNIINVNTGEMLTPNPGVTTSYTFTQPGTYAVHVKVISDKGVESIAWVDITVTN